MTTEHFNELSEAELERLSFNAKTYHVVAWNPPSGSSYVTAELVKV